MNIQFLFGVVTVFGVLGIALFIAGLFNFLSYLPRRGKSALEGYGQSEKGDDDFSGWPLSARIARSVFSLRRDPALVENLDEKLRRAGYPYDSAAHYYGRQLLYTFLFGAFGLVATSSMSMFGVNLSPITVLLISFAMAVWGSQQPGGEVSKKITDRRESIIVDMNTGLPRLILHFRARNTVGPSFEAYINMAKTGSAELEELIISKQEAEQENIEFHDHAAQTLAGFGGNLFADIVNRMAINMSGETDYGLCSERTKMWYPQTIEVERFLNIIVTGTMSQFPVVERLQDLAKDLRIDHRLRQKENGAKARQLVMVTSALMLFPILLVIGGPLFAFMLAFF